MKLSGLVFAMCSVLASAANLCLAQSPDNSVPTFHGAPPAWSGFYLGLQLGGHFTATHVGTAETVQADLGRDGVFGGIQFGDGRMVHGLYVGGEADSAFGRFVSGHVLSPVAGGLTTAFEAHRRFVGTVRAKAGRPFGRVLVYGTGGFALGGLEQGVKFSGPAAAAASQLTASRGAVEPGYTVGAGAEYRASRRLSYQVESLYYRLGDETLSVAAAPVTGYTSTLQNGGGLLRVGANYRF